jgi:hypothetical protein
MVDRAYGAPRKRIGYVIAIFGQVKIATFTVLNGFSFSPNCAQKRALKGEYGSPEFSELSKLAFPQ